MVSLWSSQCSGNLGDRPQSVFYHELKHNNFPAGSQSWLWLTAGLPSLWRECWRGEKEVELDWPWWREMMLVMISTNNWVPECQGAGQGVWVGLTQPPPTPLYNTLTSLSGQARDRWDGSPLVQPITLREYVARHHQTSGNWNYQPPTSRWQQDD